MNKRQIEVQKIYAAHEEDVIRQLKLIYAQASEDCGRKIQELSARSDMENLQSIIWQKQYQEVLKKQLDTVLDELEGKSFTTIAGYLTECYETGFFGTLYDLQGQGVPLLFPINQEEVVKAIQVDSKISQGLYKRMGEDTDKLKDSIRTELSRGISNGSSWNAIAKSIAEGMNSPFTKAYNRTLGIARTEGHRVQQESTYHCQQRAKAKGADVVKQWDSTLDSLTRPTHVELNGQIREMDEPFEVAGKSAMYPGGFGDPAEDCNCRCCLLQRARWALAEEDYYTKWNGDKNELVKVKASAYNEFKETANTLNGSLDYRVVNYVDGDYSVKERVTFLEAMTKMPQKVKDALENTVVSVGSQGSAYNPDSDTIYIGKDASLKEVIHEIGHAIEDKLFDKGKVDFVKQQCVKGLTVDDIVMMESTDSSGNSVVIFTVSSDKLLDVYQGRLYINDPMEAILPDGSIDTGYMEEFISVAVQRYYENPQKVKQKNYDIFSLVEGVLG